MGIKMVIECKYCGYKISNEVHYEWSVTPSSCDQCGDSNLEKKKIETVDYYKNDEEYFNKLKKIKKKRDYE